MAISETKANMKPWNNILQVATFPS